MTDARPSSIERLVGELASTDMIERTTARQCLVEIGKPAVDTLTAALSHPQQHVRWEAAKTLEAIADPASIPLLVEALQDADGDVRWVVGEALIALGKDSIVPVLKTLLADPDNPVGLYENAHQVLHGLANDSLRPILAPVLEALKRGEPEVATPLAAQAAIEALASLP